MAIGQCIIFIHPTRITGKVLRRHWKRHLERGGWNKVDGTEQGEGIFYIFHAINVQ
jgi:hypothetical protein